MTPKTDPLTPLPERVLKHRDILELSGATSGQLDHWKKLGVLVPDIKEGTASGDHSLYSLTNAIQAATWREMAERGLSGQQLQQAAAMQRAKLESVAPHLRASWAFYFHVQVVEAIVRITGPGPNYAQWVKDVQAFVASWSPRKKTAFDDQILQILAGRAARRAREAGAAHAE
jgi:hypothetical protein